LGEIVLADVVWRQRDSELRHDQAASEHLVSVIPTTRPRASYPCCDAQPSNGHGLVALRGSDTEIKHVRARVVVIVLESGAANRDAYIISPSWRVVLD